MTKQIFILLTIASAIGFFSCKKEIAPGQNEILASNASAAQANGEGVPFKGSYTTVNTIIQPPPNMMQTVEGAGVATQLGKSTFSAISNVTISGAPPFAVTGTKTFTAANGDQLFTTFTGISTPIEPGVNRANLHEVITGGTGRFANASGSFETVAHANQNTGIFTADVDGRISLR